MSSSFSSKCRLRQSNLLSFELFLYCSCTLYYILSYIYIDYAVRGLITLVSCDPWGAIKWVCLPIHTRTNSWGSAIIRLTAHFICGLMSALVICMHRKERGHKKRHRMFLLKSGVMNNTIISSHPSLFLPADSKCEKKLPWSVMSTSPGCGVLAAGGCEQTIHVSLKPTASQLTMCQSQPQSIAALVIYCGDEAMRGKYRRWDQGYNCCPDYPSCLLNAIQMGQATWAVWALVKKWNQFGLIAVTFQICSFLLKTEWLSYIYTLEIWRHYQELSTLALCAMLKL